MRKEFILMPRNVGDSSGFIIPKKQYELDFGKQYRVTIEEVE